MNPFLELAGNVPQEISLSSIFGHKCKDLENIDEFLCDKIQNTFLKSDDDFLSYMLECYIKTFHIQNKDMMNLVHNKIINNAVLCLNLDFEFDSEKNLDSFYESSFVQCNTELQEKEFFERIFDKIDSENEEKIIEKFVLKLLKNMSNQVEIKPVKLTKNSRLLFDTRRDSFINFLMILAKYSNFLRKFFSYSHANQFLDSNSGHGFTYELGIIGRTLLGSHLYCSQSSSDFLNQSFHQNPQGEFFYEKLLTKQLVKCEQGQIWQLTSVMDENLHGLFKTILRTGKNFPNIRSNMLKWFGECLQANKGRASIGSTMNPEQMELNKRYLASDGFLSNLCSLLVNLCEPFLNTKNYAVSEGFDDLCKKVQIDYCCLAPEDSRVRLREIVEYTKLCTLAKTTKNLNSSGEFPLLTELFFITHYAIHISFKSLFALHLETNRQLSQLENTLSSREDFASSELNLLLQRSGREMTSRFLEQVTSLSDENRLNKLVSLMVTSAIYLNHLAKKDAESGFTTDINLSKIPEFVFENILEIFSFLRRMKDEYLEDINFEPIVEFSVLFMSHPRFLSNPHLRARLAELFESLMPYRMVKDENDFTRDSQWNYSSNSFLMPRRTELFDRCSQPDVGILKNAVSALICAFVSIELMPGNGEASTTAASEAISESRVTDDENRSGNMDNVQIAAIGFEEKFQYRRPVYACLKFWNDKVYYTEQLHRLENFALDNIEDQEPPIMLQFLSLLINDVTFLLDEGFSLLSQMKAKERERLEKGGKFNSQNEEMLFQHTGRLTSHHLALGTDTICALADLSVHCSKILSHIVLVDRLACMLNYFLDRLVSKKRKEISVQNKTIYKFNPHKILREISKIYIELGQENQHTCSEDAKSFRRAVVSDERSYSDSNFEEALKILTCINCDKELLDKFSMTIEKLKTEKAQVQDEDIDNFDDIPDEFCDPIMGLVMRDPVILPTSNKVLDRKTINRHLLSDSTDPFNRKKLKMSDLIPDTELKKRIDDWIENHRKKVKEES